MPTVSDRPSFEEEISDAHKADSTRQWVTFNPNKASPGQTLYVAVPKLDKGAVLTPGKKNNHAS